MTLSEVAEYLEANSLREENEYKKEVQLMKVVRFVGWMVYVMNKGKGITKKPYQLMPLPYEKEEHKPTKEEFEHIKERLKKEKW